MKENINRLNRYLDEDGLSGRSLEELDDLIEESINELEFAVETAELNYEILKKDIAIYALRQSLNVGNL